MTTSALRIQLQSASGEWVDVGTLVHQQNNNWFEFLPEYWSKPDRPVLGQIFEEHGRNWRPNAHIALPHWFSHLLPEGRLREAVARTAQVNAKREFELLTHLGLDDLPGAVRAIETEPTTKHLTAPKQSSTGEPDGDFADDPILKFSLAGAQLKFSVLSRDQGLTVPATGSAGNFILKFPDNRPGYSGVPEAELGSLELARQVGIETPSAKLVPTESVVGLEDWASAYPGSALAVERFDRTVQGDRVHMEEVAQIINISATQELAKYQRANFEMIGTVLSGLIGPAVVAEIIDRIVLNVLIGNGDAHLKNWAVIYPDGRKPEISPIYDILPTVLYLPDNDLGLNLGGSKDFDSVVPQSFGKLGDRTGYGAKQAENRAREAATRIASQWSGLESYLDGSSYKSLTQRRDSLLKNFD